MYIRKYIIINGRNLIKPFCFATPCDVPCCRQPVRREFHAAAWQSNPTSFVPRRWLQT